MSLDHFGIQFIGVFWDVGSATFVNIAGICRGVHNGVHLSCMFVGSNKCILMVYAEYLDDMPFCFRFNS